MMTNVTEEQLELFNENFRLKLVEEQINTYDNYELTLDDLEAPRFRPNRHRPKR